MQNKWWSRKKITNSYTLLGSSKGLGYKLCLCWGERSKFKRDLKIQISKSTISHLFPLHVSEWGMKSDCFLGLGTKHFLVYHMIRYAVCWHLWNLFAPKPTLRLNSDSVATRYWLLPFRVGAWIHSWRIHCFIGEEKQRKTDSKRKHFSLNLKKGKQRQALSVLSVQDHTMVVRAHLCKMRSVYFIISVTWE